MGKNDRLFTIPFMGPYTAIFVKALRKLDLDVRAPMEISDKTNKLGVRNTAEMVCWPLKSTLGSLVQTFEMSPITDVITYSTESQCRFRHFGNIYRLALKNLGYDVNVHIIRNGYIFRDLRKATGASYWQIWQTFKDMVDYVKLYERMWADRYRRITNVLLIGEIYTLLTPEVNFNIREKLVDLDMGSVLAVDLSTFIQSDIKGKEIYRKEAAQYIDKHTGGHGFDNICHVLDHKQNVAGVIYVYPLSCGPENTVMPIIEHICKESKLPLLRIEIDDNSNPLNIQTRLEAFVDTIKRRQKICLT